MLFLTLIKLRAHCTSGPPGYRSSNSVPFGQYASSGILYFFLLLIFFLEKLFASCSSHVTWLASHKRCQISVYFLEPLLEILPANLPFEIFPTLIGFNLTNNLNNLKDALDCWDASA